MMTNAFGQPALRFGVMLCVILFSSATANAQADSAQPINEAVIKSWIEPKIGIVVTQQVNLLIEIATPYWFTGGTRIGNIEIENVVILRRDQFSINSTRRIGTQTWSVQLWTVTLYPQQPGEFQIPAIGVRVSTANKDGQASTRELSTKKINFVASVPPQLTAELPHANVEKYSWLATARLEVSERYSKETSNLEIGDSVERIIEVRSENVAAMMLPALQVSAPDGLASYRQPTKIEDKVNRGVYLASRTDSISYVIEKPGTYTLPQLDVYWWNLTTQSLQHEVLPERIISTNAPVAEVVEGGKQIVEAESAYDVKLIFRALAAIFLVLTISVISRRRLRSRSGISKRDRKDEMFFLKKNYKQECRHGNYQRACDVLYKWVNFHLIGSGLAENEHSLRQWLQWRNETETLKLFDDLMSAAHSQSPSNVDDRERLEALIEEVQKIAQSPQSGASMPDVFELRLN